jgi:ribonuclease BN (tRNA processing enzyme)
VRLRILGTRGNVALSAPRHARRSGILVDGRILLDLGEAAYLRAHPSHILITHLHPDHAAFLTRRVAIRAPVYVPERTAAWPAARALRGPLTLGPYRIVPVPTVHSARARSVGFVVEKDGRRFFFSSDLAAIAPRYRSRLRDLDLVVTDGSFARRGGLVRIDPATGRRFGHAGIPDLVGYFSAFTRRILITHFGSWYYRDVSASRRWIASLSDGARVRAAHDGMVVVV